MTDTLRPPLVTLQMAVDHLRLPLTVSPSSPETDPLLRDLRLKLETAQQMILDYLKDRASSDWEDEHTTPPLVQGAILIQMTELWRFRGDDPGSIEQSPKYDDGQLSPTITNMLRRWRDPALA